jgi:hypothetical protein
MKNETENEKKRLFANLKVDSKAKKSSCCCNFEVEEIPEEKRDNKNEKKPTKDKNK